MRKKIEEIVQALNEASPQLQRISHKDSHRQQLRLDLLQLVNLAYSEWMEMDIDSMRIYLTNHIDHFSAKTEDFYELIKNNKIPKKDLPLGEKEGTTYGKFIDKIMKRILNTLEKIAVNR